MSAYKSLLSIILSLQLIFTSVMAASQDQKIESEAAAEYHKLVNALEKQGVEFVDEDNNKVDIRKEMVNRSFLAFNQKSVDGNDYHIGVADVSFDEKTNKLEFYLSGYVPSADKPFATDTLVQIQLEKSQLDINNTRLMETLGTIDQKFQRSLISKNIPKKIMKSLVELIFPSAHAQNGYAENYDRGFGDYGRGANYGRGNNYGNGPAPDDLLGGNGFAGNGGGNSAGTAYFTITAMNLITLMITLMLVGYKAKNKLAGVAFIAFASISAFMLIENNFFNGTWAERQLFQIPDGGASSKIRNFFNFIK